MQPLTPTEQVTLDALNETPSTSAEVRERSGRSRSATDKALAALADAGLATRLAAETENDGPARWISSTIQHPDDQDPDTGTGPTEQPGDDLIDSRENTDAPSAARDETDRPAARSDDGIEQPADDADTTKENPGNEGDQPDEPDEPPAAEVKLCRVCQEQMPVICPCCWSRTPAYCGECRKKMPARQRGNPDEPLILPNGLPKLSRGQLEQMVAGVMRDQPLPDHVGVTGWTSARVAVFLPGRSPGAIGNALDRLVTAGLVELLSETPKLYRPAPLQEHEEPATDDERRNREEDA